MRKNQRTGLNLRQQRQYSQANSDRQAQLTVLEQINFFEHTNFD